MKDFISTASDEQFLGDLRGMRLIKKADGNFRIIHSLEHLPANLIERVKVFLKENAKNICDKYSEKQYSCDVDFFKFGGDFVHIDIFTISDGNISPELMAMKLSEAFGLILLKFITDPLQEEFIKNTREDLSGIRRGENSRNNQVFGDDHNNVIELQREMTTSGNCVDAKIVINGETFSIPAKYVNKIIEFITNKTTEGIRIEKSDILKYVDSLAENDIVGNEENDDQSW
jgi:hypothetical protein